LGYGRGTFRFDLGPWCFHGIGSEFNLGWFVGSVVASKAPAAFTEKSKEFQVEPNAGYDDNKPKQDAQNVLKLLHNDFIATMSTSRETSPYPSGARPTHAFSESFPHDFNKP
jgi:hypothetical protein